MPSKNRRRKNPLTFKDKFLRFLVSTFIVSATALITVFYVYGDVLLKQSFPLENIEISGNRHYSDTRLITMMGIKEGDCLLNISLKDVTRSLLSNQWIKGVFIRKVLPSSLIVKVREAVPIALISLRQRLYLIDEEGEPLARIKGDRGTYLPVLTGMSLKKDREKIRESIQLIKVLKRKGVLTQNNMVRISATKDYGLVMNINEQVVRIGYGNYKSKLEKWLSVSSEITNRQMDVVYLDVRFKDQVVVKPVNFEKSKK